MQWDWHPRCKCCIGDQGRCKTSHSFLDLKKQLSDSTKLMDIRNDDFSRVHDYFQEKCVANTRMAFKVRSKMVEDVLENFENEYKKNGEDGLVCYYCDKNKIMSQSHCIESPGWTELKRRLDMTNTMDVVEFYRKLLSERARLEREGVTMTATHDSEL